MQAEIISNGDELSSGKILDTNAQWLSRELADLGVTTTYHTTVGDDFEAMLDVLRIASRRADLILWTGGLGPTADDLTRQAIARFANLPLEKNEDLLRHLRTLILSLGHEMPESNVIQAFLPRGALPIRNPHGTAPGIDLTVKRDETPAGRLDFFRIMAFPGVPDEIEEMWKKFARKSIRDMLDRLGGHRRVLRYRSLHCFGKGESQIEAMLPGLIVRDHYPKVGITAGRGTITLRIVAEAENEKECCRIMEPTARQIYETLGDLVFGEDEDRLQDVVLRKLQENDKTVAAVEVGTRGLLAESLAGCPVGADRFFGSLVLSPKHAVSADRMVSLGKKMMEQVAPENVCPIDYLLLVGPYPAEKPGRDGKGETFIAVADVAADVRTEADFIAYETYPFVGRPGIVDDLHVKRALNLLRKILSKNRS